MRKIVAFVGLAAIVALLAYTYYALTQARQIADMPVSISVTGKGEAFAKSDIASFSFSVLAKESTASLAQSKSAESINKILAFLKEKGVEEKDVNTSGYYLNPRYEYPKSECNEWGYCPPTGGEPKLVGYEVSQTVEVKVRKIDDVGMLISGAGELGATNMSGPSFTIDDDSKYIAEAREKAIADARAQAEVLAKNLGVRIVRMTGFWEEMPSPYGYGGYAKAEMSMMSADAAIVPEMPAGENQITSTVNIQYEIK